MGRKRNKGKARKAAKAKAREGEEGRANNDDQTTANGRQQSLADHRLQQLELGAAPKPPQRVGRGGNNQQPPARAPAYGMMPPPQQQMMGQGGGEEGGLGFLPQNRGEPIRYSFADEYGNEIMPGYVPRRYHNGAPVPMQQIPPQQQHQLWGMPQQVPSAAAAPRAKRALTIVDKDGNVVDLITGKPVPKAETTTTNDKKNDAITTTDAAGVEGATANLSSLQPQRNQATDGQQQSLAEQMQRMQIGDTTECWHGLDERFDKADNILFLEAFEDAFSASVMQGAATAKSLADASDATMDKYAEVWNDSIKMETVVSFLLSNGTQHVLEHNYDGARVSALFFRFFEQYIAAVLHQSQAIMNLPKIDVILNGRSDIDLHSLVKLFRRRVPCSCLDEKYHEVKCITKMGLCYNPECRLNPSGEVVERSKTMYCSRCRNATYCSRECQKADWTRHRPACDECVARIAKFEAKKRSIDNVP
eukprot:scaffold4462_cov119-Skeletonema_dohrnii-CCMP3373.AAC.6